MEKIVRRVHARVNCDRPVDVFSDAATGPLLGVARLLDLSLSGAMIAYDGLLRPGASYRVRLDDFHGSIELPFRVAREAPRGRKYPQVRHYGLSFNLTGSQERVLLELIEAIRAHPTPDEDTLLDRLLRSYWSR
ncbi:MAG: PilZ domain-containing protein [Elusimicrobia bacterium]|nr:PilZ domain-containing protein [Elusimicrobiota bacterium]